MKYTIHKNGELQQLIDTLELPVASSIQSVVKSLLKESVGNQDDFIEIEISPSLIADAYIGVPQMFARQIKAHSPFRYTQSYMQNKLFVVYAGANKRPTTFRDRVRLALKGEEGRIEIPVEEIPATYRERPATLAEQLTLALEKTIIAIPKTNTVIWKVKK